MMRVGDRVVVTQGPWRLQPGVITAVLPRAKLDTRSRFRRYEVRLDETVYAGLYFARWELMHEWEAEYEEFTLKEQERYERAHGRV